MPTPRPNTPTIRKTVTTLADGRELIYYDDEATAVSTDYRAATDTRALPPAVSDSQLRYDVLTGEWIAVAAERMDRTFLPPPEASPLAPSRAGTAPTEIPAADYDVVVFENRFPALSPRAAAQRLAPFVDSEPLWPLRAGAGRCEVVCFTSDPTARFATLGHRRARMVIDVWADRTADLSAMPGVEQVFCFENRGREIGVTLTHPHGQIFAYPYLPPRTEALLRQARAHRASTGGHLLADVLAAEQHSGRRVVYRGEHWSAFVPAAARWPLEVHLVPHRDVPDFTAVSEGEKDELATVYLDLLARVDRFFEGVHETPYIAAWHQAPVGDDRELGRLHLQLFSVMRSPGRLKYLAGSESGMGAWINDTTPERIADRMREIA
ncbi:galactose-1-phosphate uridylyltransferase [Mycobacterium neglectum]|uniref:galactose-1-phosphate uridylyltransferase n=1 Tax=Mycobacterium neglectum TaxID=242737 RepID=UPI000BFEAE9B|nr:galactose-1-phosphate uridylyltransferase [Mycobacterium neglectum]